MAQRPDRRAPLCHRLLPTRQGPFAWIFPFGVSGHTCKTEWRRARRELSDNPRSGVRGRRCQVRGTGSQVCRRDTVPGQRIDHRDVPGHPWVGHRSRQRPVGALAASLPRVAGRSSRRPPANTARSTLLELTALTDSSETSSVDCAAVCAPAPSALKASRARTKGISRGVPMDHLHSFALANPLPGPPGNTDPENSDTRDGERFLPLSLQAQPTATKRCDAVVQVASIGENGAGPGSHRAPDGVSRKSPLTAPMSSGGDKTSAAEYSVGESCVPAADSESSIRRPTAR